MDEQQPQNCPVCSSAQRELYAVARDVEYCSCPEMFRYFECVTCGSLYIENPPVTRLGEIYPRKYYSNNTEFTHSFLFRIKERMERWTFKRILSNIPGKTLSVLDIGGGTGWILTSMKHANSRITETTVLDIDGTCQPTAERAGHIFYCGRIEDFQIARTFDFILALNLIEHVAHPAAVLCKISTLLKPNGVVLIKTPNVNSWDRFLFRRAYWGGLHCPRHWVLFNKASFIWLAEQSGLSVQKLSYTQGSPQWTSSILGTLAKFGLIHFSPERPMYTYPLVSVLTALTAGFDFLRSPFYPTAQMFILARRS